jgi:hypothetical protein
MDGFTLPLKTLLPCAQGPDLFSQFLGAGLVLGESRQMVGTLLHSVCPPFAELGQTDVMVLDLRFEIEDEGLGLREILGQAGSPPLMGIELGLCLSQKLFPFPQGGLAFG